MRLVALLVLVGCPGPPSDGSLDEAGRRILARWPDLGTAWDDRHFYDGEGAWYWAHRDRSVDGFGVTLAAFVERPGARALVSPPESIRPTTDTLRPTLLFFDQTDDPQDRWPLIGFGYHDHYHPCVQPPVDGIAADAWLLHEAGYHHVPLGSGGMTAATDADLRQDAVSSSVDAKGCEPVYAEDLKRKTGTVRHGRAWTVHAWLSPDADSTQLMATDPWERWTDAPKRVEADDALFVYPDNAGCGCEIEAPRGGCSG